MSALRELLTATDNVVMTKAQLDAQRISFAFGNTRIDNSRITREMIANAAHK